MQIKTKHFCLLLGYDMSRDADYALAICMFHRAAPRGHRRFHFVLECGIEAPKLFRVHGGSDYSHVPDAVNSARWTGRDYEIRGWYWPAWFNVCLGRRWFAWASKCWYWPSPQTQYRRYMAEKARKRQEMLNSAMITARIENPRAPDWLIRARAQNIAGL